MTVISVIGPDVGVVEQVADGLRTGAGKTRVFVAGAGPGEADGVVAVVTGVPDESDLQVIRAVRDAMGVVVVYTSGDTQLGEVAEEPGVLLCRWAGGDAAGGLGALGSLVGGLWVDVDAWVADARRADADRLDRVRIAVRLAADRAATGLLSGGVAEDELPVRDAEFRARLSVAVLEQGVDMPHLSDELPDADAPPPGKDALATRMVTAGAALGAGVATVAALLRLADALVIAVCGGVLVAAGTAGVRWWAGRAARRERDGAHRAAVLRRHWAATVTDVVARLEVRPVSGSLPGGVS